MVPVNVKVSNNVILALLCSAMEGGGSHSWCVNVEEMTAPTLDDLAKIEGYWHWSQKWPVAGGVIALTEVNPDTGQRKLHNLGPVGIKRGLQKMADGSPVRFSDALSGQIDNETGDVFLQYCLFGEIKYE